MTRRQRAAKPVHSASPDASEEEAATATDARSAGQMGAGLTALNNGVAAAPVDDVLDMSTREHSMAESSNPTGGDLSPEARDLSSPADTSWAPSLQPLVVERRFAGFYGPRQLGTSAYATPAPGSDVSVGSPSRWKEVRPFRLAHGVETDALPVLG